jgi:hypothetical protein
LRESSVLARAIGEAVARSEAKYALADRFDEAKGEYSGLKLWRVVEVDLNSEALLVRGDTAQTQLRRRRPSPRIPETWSSDRL